jgi:hypothetical protein
MPGLEWAFKLRDQVTQPAGNIESQLRRVGFALKTLDLAAKNARLDKIADPLKKTRLELQIHRDKLLLSKRAIEDHSRATQSASRSWTDSLLKWAGSLYILDTVARGFRAVGRAALAMSDQVKEAIETRQRGLFGLRANMGDQGGSQLFAQLQRQAQIYGRPPGEIVGMGSTFQRSAPDLSNGGVQRLIATVEDVRARTGGKADISGAIQGILESPIVGVSNLQAFSQAGPLKGLWKAFGARMNMRPGDAEQFLNLHGVQGGANSPLLDAVQQWIAGMPGQRGQLGTSAKGFADKTLEGSIGRVQTAWEKLLGSLENSQGVKTLQSVLQSLAATLGGQKVQGAMTSLADALGDALKPLTGPEGKKNMQAFFSSMADEIQKTIPGLQALVTAFGALAKWGVLKPLQGLGMLSDVAGDMADIANGKAPSTATGKAFLDAAFGDLRGPDAEGGYAGGLNNAAFLRARATNPATPPTQGPGMLARPINVTVHAPVSVRFDGVTKDDGHALVRSFSDNLKTALSDALEEIGIESGAQPGPGQ